MKNISPWHGKDGNFTNNFLSQCLTTSELQQFQIQSARHDSAKERYKSLVMQSDSLEDEVRRKLLLIFLAWTDDSVGGVSEF
jgi:hypothetical protein